MKVLGSVDEKLAGAGIEIGRAVLADFGGSGTL
jgi:hypothetical protein